MTSKFTVDKPTVDIYDASIKYAFGSISALSGYMVIFSAFMMIALLAPFSVMAYLNQHNVQFMLNAYIIAVVSTFMNGSMLLIICLFVKRTAAVYSRRFYSLLEVEDQSVTSAIATKNANMTVPTTTVYRSLIDE